MVINGGARGRALRLAVHLLRVDTNERMEVRELSGVSARDLTGALHEMEAMGSGSRSRRPLYHANIDWRVDEGMSDAQKARAVAELGDELGLGHLPRVVVEHVKSGREHLHVVWLRIDPETGKAVPDSHNYRKHELVARRLEIEFGHARVQGAHVERNGIERPARCPTFADLQQAERSGVTPEEAKAQLRTLWQSSDNGRSFAAALDEAGWVLARGDKRNVMVALDSAGNTHAVNKDITGLTAAKVRERLADIEGRAFPGVDEARQQIEARCVASAEREREAAKAAPEPARDPQPEPGQAELAEEKRRRAIQQADDIMKRREQVRASRPSDRMIAEALDELALTDPQRFGVAAAAAHEKTLLRPREASWTGMPANPAAPEIAREARSPSLEGQGREAVSGILEPVHAAATSAARPPTLDLAPPGLLPRLVGAAWTALQRLGNRLESAFEAILAREPEAHRHAEESRLAFPKRDQREAHPEPDQDRRRPARVRMAPEPEPAPELSAFEKRKEAAKARLRDLLPRPVQTGQPTPERDRENELQRQMQKSWKP